MIERFNAEKAALIADNVRKGKSVKGSIENASEAIKLRQKKVDDANAELATLQAAAPVNIPAEPTEAELEALYNDYNQLEYTLRSNDYRKLKSLHF